jgi:L-2-hydroxyglutarate oxidase
MKNNYDIVIVGAGILGLSVAREILSTKPKLKICILEKETGLGYHSSGRNSGILHSGIYYPEKSLKAKFCADGAKMLADFCDEFKLPIERIGKVILPTQIEDDPTLEILMERGRLNGVNAKILDSNELSKVEPLARSITNRAVHVPSCAVVDPKTILETLAKLLTDQGASLIYNAEFVSADTKNGSIKLRDGRMFLFGHFINAAGLYADQIAHAFDVGHNYVIMPFKGLYYDVVSDLKNQIRGLIYPAPDLRLPFLGVHFTKSVEGKVYLGPNALPAMGRENYHGYESIKIFESIALFNRILKQYLRNEQGFRRLVHDELKRLRKPYFVKAAQALVPNISGKDILRGKKVGIRAQLFDIKTQKLVMDFLVETGPKSTHILNAVSPGFTCGPSFAAHIVKELPFS